jgi:hypothetical protein
VFESESLFSEFYIRGTVFFTKVPLFNALPGMFLMLYSSIIIKVQIRSLRMVTVASDFLIMLNGKWSSQKFQDEQINEKFGVAFSDGDICIFCYNINVESIPSQPY